LKIEWSSLPVVVDYREDFARSAASVRSKFFAAHGFAIGLGVLALCKLWLVHAEEIWVNVEPYDASWFLAAAQRWYWGAAYGRMAFIRPAAYPLWIASVHLFGMPLRVAIELLQIAGAVVLVVALRRVGLGRVVCLLIFATMIFHPAGFQANNLVRSDLFYAGVLWMAIGGLIIVALNRRVAHAVGTGLAFAILWNTREESFLLLIVLVGFFAFVWIQNYIATQSWNVARQRLTTPFFAMLLTLLLVNATFCLANYFAFGSFAKSEINSSDFKSAYKALLRIKPESSQRFVPVSHTVLQRAYDISPTFARLRPQLEGPTGNFWRQVTVAEVGVPNEFGAGWFVWALREAAEPLGIYRNAQESNRFYRAIATEINQAGDRVASRPLFVSFLDPGAFASWQYLPQSFVKIVRTFVHRYQMSPAREVGRVAVGPAQRALYNEMAGRRLSLSYAATLQIIGATFRPDDRIRLVGFRNTDHEIDAVTDQFVPEPDLINHFKLSQDANTNTRFVLRIPLYRNPKPSGELIFITKNGAEFSGPVTEVLAGKAPRAGNQTLLCWIRSQEIITPTHRKLVTVENLIGKYYGTFLIALSGLGLFALFILLIFVRRLCWNDPVYLVLIVLAITIASRVALFSFIDATAWPGDAPRYSFPVMPLYSAFVIVLIYQAGRVASEVLKSKATSLGRATSSKNRIEHT
jgi:hypothetical protein